MVGGSIPPEPTMTNVRIPTTADALTPEWLTDALAQVLDSTQLEPRKEERDKKPGWLF